jgi:hypothetical protein
MIVVSHAIVAASMCEDYGRHVNMDLLHLVRARLFTSSVVTVWGYKTVSCPCAQPHPLTQSIKRDYWDLESVAYTSLSSHGGTRLDPFLGENASRSLMDFGD